MDTENTQSVVTGVVTPNPHEGTSSTSIQSDNLQEPQTKCFFCEGIFTVNAMQSHVSQTHPTMLANNPTNTQTQEAPQENKGYSPNTIHTAEPKENSTTCNCVCHMQIKPLDESVHAQSCYHCKPEAHQQPKQENYPNLNAGNNNEDNKWAEKWKTAEERILACQRYCDYIRKGRSKKYYPEAAPATIQKYMENYPEEFRPEKIADAEREGLAYIESIGFAGMTGKIKGFNATTWIWITKNKLNWRDKMQFVDDEDYETEWGNGEEKA